MTLVLAMLVPLQWQLLPRQPLSTAYQLAARPCQLPPHHLPRCTRILAGFVSNVVITSRYTWYNFIPVFLFQQFTRFANFYFLIVRACAATSPRACSCSLDRATAPPPPQVCILQAINELSITNGVPSSAIPLAFVLFFDGIVTAREDYVRHRDDARANSRNVETVRDGRFATVQWREVQVGDIVKVYGGDEFPADMIFLAAGEGGCGWWR